MTDLDSPTTSAEKKSRCPSRCHPWSKPREWCDKGFKKSRAFLRTAISRKSWLDKSVCGENPFTYNKVTGFYQFTVTLDRKKSKFGGKKYSTDRILRAFVAMMESEFAGVVVFDIGKNGSPHMHGFVSVPTDRKFEKLVAILDGCRATFGEQIDWGKLYTPDDLGKWVGYTLQNKPWHGDLPHAMEQKFGRYRGMASVFGNTPEANDIAIRVASSGDVIIEVPKEVITLSGEVITLPLATVRGFDKESRIKHIAENAAFGLGAMLSVAASSLISTGASRMMKKVGLDRLQDRGMVSLIQATYVNCPKKAAAMIYAQLFEMKGTRMFKAVESVLAVGGTIELVVDGNVVPPSLDRSLFGVNFRPLKDGKSLI